MITLNFLNLRMLEVLFVTTGTTPAVINKLFDLFINAWRGIHLIGILFVCLHTFTNITLSYRSITVVFTAESNNTSSHQQPILSIHQCIAWNTFDWYFILVPFTNITLSYRSITVVFRAESNNTSSHQKPILSIHQCIAWNTFDWYFILVPAPFHQHYLPFNHRGV